jgi:carboxylate-amine ligase
MTQPPRIHLFQGYGVELEYMLVDKDSLKIQPITDELLKHELGTYGSDFENDIITWSNELVLHVVELKSTKPEKDFPLLNRKFAENIKKINAILSSWNAILMPTAAHPFMNPLSETRIWPHENNEVYAVYNKIFDCRGHGWSNLQSTHLNLPFYDDEEFAKLHAAIRLVLPILPALCASSPILDGKLTGLLDTRLKFYKSNQAKIPSITGKVIPEAVFSKRNYLNTIYEKIKADIAPYDPGEELNAIWVNSRGAIPRFDRGSIEIRVMDIQECPAADLAALTLVIETIKAFARNEFANLEAQMKWKTELLAQIFDQTIRSGQLAILDNAEYLALFDFPTSKASASELWQHILDYLLKNGNPALDFYKKELNILTTEGTLAFRIVKAIGKEQSSEKIADVYRKLCDCLANNTMFLP